MSADATAQNISLPFAVWREGDMAFYDTLEDGLRKISAGDVIDSDCKAFDADGRRLKLVVEKGGRKRIAGLGGKKGAHISIEAGEFSEETMAELKCCLLEYLEIRVGDTQAFETQDLCTLFALARKAADGDTDKTAGGQTGLFSYK